VSEQSDPLRLLSLREAGAVLGIESDARSVTCYNQGSEMPGRCSNSPRRGTRSWRLPMQADLIPCACGCGEMIPSVDKDHRPHRYVWGHQNRRRPPAVPRTNADGACLIDLTRGYVALVDAVDYPMLTAYTWTATVYPNTVYAKATVRGPDGRWTPLFMHRLIIPTPLEVDHVNGDGLDNRRANLRPATQHQQNGNQRPRLGCASAYKGVHWHKQTGRWNAQIKSGAVRRSLGLFAVEADAARAYDAAARQFFGEFARVNFPASP
jgi:hypothetical protein